MAFDDKQLLDEEFESSANEDDKHYEFDDKLTEDTVNELSDEELPQTISRQLTESFEVKLTAEAGSVSISLKQLLELAPGDILDLAALPPKVKLLVNNVVIGNGFLVELNGRIGVKITHLTGVTPA